MFICIWLLKHGIGAYCIDSQLWTFHLIYIGYLFESAVQRLGLRKASCYELRLDLVLPKGDYIVHDRKVMTYVLLNLMLKAVEVESLFALIVALPLRRQVVARRCGSAVPPFSRTGVETHQFETHTLTV